MGAALTYARRYALFALVGIAGEDDLDAPDAAAGPPAPPNPKASPGKGALNRAPVLRPGESAALREQLLRQLEALPASTDLLSWAMASLPLKNACRSRMPGTSRQLIRPSLRTLAVLRPSRRPT